MSLQGKIKPSSFRSSKYFKILLKKCKNKSEENEEGQHLRMILEVVESIENLRIEFRDDVVSGRDNKNSIIDEHHVSSEQYMNHYLENRIIVGIKDIQDNDEG